MFTSLRMQALSFWPIIAEVNTRFGHGWSNLPTERWLQMIPTGSASGENSMYPSGSHCKAFVHQAGLHRDRRDPNTLLSSTTPFFLDYARLPRYRNDFWQICRISFSTLIQFRNWHRTMGDVIYGRHPLPAAVASHDVRLLRSRGEDDRCQPPPNLPPSIGIARPGGFGKEAVGEGQNRL